MTREEKNARALAYCGEEYGCGACPCKELASARCTDCNFYEMEEHELDEFLRRFEADKSRHTASVDNVNHPQHYELPNGIECFDVLLATQGKEAAQAFCICNAIKYLFRHKRKNGAEDVKKAKWYIDKYIELEG